MTVGCRANVSLPFVTKAGLHTKYTKRLTCVDPYQTLPDRMLAERNHWWFWFGGATVYQGLPVCRSGSTPAVCDLYQPLPPHRRTGHRLTSGRPRAPGGWVGQRGEGYRSRERWHSVAQRGEPSTPSEVGQTARSVSERKKKKNLTRSACVF